MTCKPNYTSHAWGRSIHLTPDCYDEEVVIAWMEKPFIYSSVHHHEWKKNKIICNSGCVKVDIFKWGISPEDLMKGSVETSDYDSVLLMPGDHVEIEAMLDHRISSLSDKVTLITEIYLSDYDYMPPHSDDIVRMVDGGQKVETAYKTVYH